jgi:hypothetical protein
MATPPRNNGGTGDGSRPPPAPPGAFDFEDEESGAPAGRPAQGDGHDHGHDHTPPAAASPLTEKRLIILLVIAAAGLVFWPFFLVALALGGWWYLQANVAKEDIIKGAGFVITAAASSQHGGGHGHGEHGHGDDHGGGPQIIPPAPPVKGDDMKIVTPSPQKHGLINIMGGVTHVLMNTFTQTLIPNGDGVVLPVVNTPVRMRNRINAVPGFAVWIADIDTSAKTGKCEGVEMNPGGQKVLIDVTWSLHPIVGDNGHVSAANCQKLVLGLDTSLKDEVEAAVKRAINRACRNRPASFLKSENFGYLSEAATAAFQTDIQKYGLTGTVEFASVEASASAVAADAQALQSAGIPPWMAYVGNILESVLGNKGGGQGGGGNRGGGNARGGRRGGNRQNNRGDDD